jgi:hypoxanthine phosphoribosyltransferase
MTLKLVLISPSGTLVDENNNLHKKHVSSLCTLILNLEKEGIKVVIWSNRKWTLENKVDLGEYLTQKSGVKVDYILAGQGGYPVRRRGDSVLPVLEKFNVQKSETILVGNGKEDVLAGVNNGLLLLRPSWYLHDSEYGFLVSSLGDLERFCILFGLRKHPIFWSLKNIGLEIYAMGPYSTRIKEYEGFGTNAFQSAKHENGTIDFWHKLIVSTLYFSGLVDGIDYITIYPSHSSGSRKKAIDEVMTLFGKCFRKTFYSDLLLRHTTSVKSAFAKPHEKTYKNQIETIRLNRNPKRYGGNPKSTPINLKGKKILVVDDFCTNGRSLEVARIYIEAAGGKAMLFSWLKTINSDYFEIDSVTNINPTNKNVLVDEPIAKIHSYKNGIVDSGAAAEISNLLDRYKDWVI